MSTLPKLFFVVLIVGMLAGPVLADQSAIGIIDGNHNTQKIYNIDKTNIEHQTVNNDIKESDISYISIDASGGNNQLGMSSLSIDNVNETILMFPGEVLAYPEDGTQTFSISSGSPIAVYSIDGFTDHLLLESDTSVLNYDLVYHRFEHGTVVPTSVFPHLTTRCWFSPDIPGYIVLDNRVFLEGVDVSTYNLVSISSG